MARDEHRSIMLRLLFAVVVLGGGYVGLCLWSAGHLPSTVIVGGESVGGMSPDQAIEAIEEHAASVLEKPIVLTVPGVERSIEVIPAKAGFSVDATRPVAGLVGFTLDPRTVWARLTGYVNRPLVTGVDDDVLTGYLTRVARDVAVPVREGSVTFPDGKVTVGLPRPGQSLDLAGTTLALRTAFPDKRAATAVVSEIAPTISEGAVRTAAETFGARAMSGPVVIVSGKTRTKLSPREFAPAVSMVPDGDGGLEPKFDKPALATLVASRIAVKTKPARPARWTFAPGHGRPVLVPSVDGTAVDAEPIPGQVAAAISSTKRTVTIKTVPTRAAFTTKDATKAGVRELVVDFTSPFPPEDTTRTHNLVVATRTINSTYVPPGGTFSLNAILGERTKAKGYGDGTVIINGRLTRGTGGGISQVSTTIYNMAYFAGADILDFTPHAFFIPRYPEGREATVYWPTVDNRWKNDTPHGMLLQTWVAGGNVHGRVWSTKTWDIRSVKGARRNVKPAKTIRDSSAKCYPQQPQPGFDVTVTRQFYRPGSSTLVKSEPYTTHYIPEDRIICTNPGAKP
ncbi:MAG: VanW family protein [Micrococcales bacterium]|nr:VanW family protein [Micrococcales bacterium]